MNRFTTFFGLAFTAGLAAAQPDIASLCADRTAIERVYYEHRLGTKPPFEQALPPVLIEQLVKQDLHKEAVLKKVYGVEISPAMVEAEMRRIDATTRAPDTLAELKKALGNDAARFARIVARPIVVERTLRARFENDDALHASTRKKTEELRTQLLAASKEGTSPDKLIALLKDNHAGAFNEVTWQLGPRPASAEDPPAQASAAGSSAAPISANARSALYSIQATAQVAQVLGSPETRADQHKFYFADLPQDLQQVLRVQLRQPGATSAVIESSGGFVLYVLKSRTDETMSVASVAVGKRSYEGWLAEQQTAFNQASSKP